MSVLHLCQSGHVVKVPMSIAQVLNLGISSQCRTRRQEIGSLPFYVDVCRNGVYRVAGHEMVDVQVVDAQLGIIPHRITIQSSFQLDRALTLAG